MKSRILLTAAAVGLLCAQPLHAQTAKPAAKPAAKPVAAAPAGPWTKVPALPTACYSDQDQWQDQSNAAFDAVQQDRYRQEDINRGISERANEIFAANPMAMAQALQQKMMSDPANAQKYMEQMMAQTQQAQTELPAQSEKEKQLENESKVLLKQYEAALEKARSAGNARLAAVMKRYSPPMGVGDLWLRYGEPGEPAWVAPERRLILRDLDSGYAANCAQWWSATGPIHAYLKRYKDYLVQERIPYMKTLDKSRLDQYQTLNIPATNWRTTTDYEAVQDYVRRAQSLFAEREIKPLCQTENHCR